MSDLFFDLAAPEGTPSDDPIEKARASVRRDLMKRFYAAASVEPSDGGGFAVLLDGRPVRTPARKTLAVPDERVARAVAAEFEAQATHVDPATMPVTRLVNSTLDGVVDNAAAVADEAAAYAGSDLLFYRADGPERLVRRQTAIWDPIVRWAEERFACRFRLAEGVMPVAQDPAALRAVREAMPDDPFELAGLHSATSLTGSALIARALFEGRLDVDSAWAAAHLDEDWNVELWGEDAEAAARRAFRRAEMDAAALLMGL